MKQPSLQDLLPLIPLDLHEKAASVLPRRIERCLELLDTRIEGVVVAAEAVYRRHNVSAIQTPRHGAHAGEISVVCPHIGPPTPHKHVEGDPIYFDSLTNAALHIVD